MKLNSINKKIIFLILGIFVILLLFIFFTKSFDPKQTEIVNDNNFGIQHNTNQEFLKDKEENGLLFKEIECTFDGTTSLISYTITNRTQNSILLNEYELIVKDKSGAVLTVINPKLEEILEPNEEISISNEVNINITNAYYLELNLPK